MGHDTAADSARQTAPLESDNIQTMRFFSRKQHKLDLILERVNKLMSATSDLQKAVADVAAAITAAVADIKALLAANGVSAADAAAATASLEQAAADLNAAVTPPAPTA